MVKRNWISKATAGVRPDKHGHRAKRNFIAGYNSKGNLFNMPKVRVSGRKTRKRTR